MPGGDWIEIGEAVELIADVRKLPVGLARTQLLSAFSAGVRTQRAAPTPLQMMIDSINCPQMSDFELARRIAWLAVLQDRGELLPDPASLPAAADVQECRYEEWKDLGPADWDSIDWGGRIRIAADDLAFWLARSEPGTPSREMAPRSAAPTIERAVADYIAQECTQQRPLSRDRVFEFCKSVDRRFIRKMVVAELEKQAGPRKRGRPRLFNNPP